jgi:ABC-type transporter Mla MlaB component
MTTTHEDDRVRITLQGVLRSSDLSLLRQELAEHASSDGEVQIDLAGVSFADAPAARFLVDLASEGVVLMRPPSYLRMLLEGD